MIKKPSAPTFPLPKAVVEPPAQPPVATPMPWPTPPTYVRLRATGHGRPGLFDVMRDVALETGIDRLVRAIDKARELWFRPPEEWELLRPVSYVDVRRSAPTTDLHRAGSLGQFLGTTSFMDAVRRWRNQ